MTTHASDGIMFEPSEGSFYRAACTCGWNTPAHYPDLEIAVDALMAHTWAAAAVNAVQALQSVLEKEL